MSLEKNTLAVIMNASSDKGIEAAKELIHQYNKILLVGDNRHELKIIAKDIAKQCPAEKVLFVETDIINKAELAKFICLVKDKFGGADLVVNCMQIEDENQKLIFNNALKSFEEAAVNQLETAE